ncbi:MAG: c-type cytochrome [Rhodobacteraceae bacterium]|nr:c-type cytochrome [Paracoccaceae bacterium]
MQRWIPENLTHPGLKAVVFCLFVLAGCFAGPDEQQTTDVSQPANDPARPESPSFDAKAVAKGKSLFWAGGCASCHAAPNSKNVTNPQLGGGLELVTAFGVFRTPNISPDKTNGIGNWTEQDFANAMQRGVTPTGSHYFPAFPYTSYARMTDEDVMNLWAYLRTLPADDTKVLEHDVAFPIAKRKALGLWKRLYFRTGSAVKLGDTSAAIARGQYLVEGPGHCGECHTPRNALGGLSYRRWLAGGTAPDGEGYVPNITPDPTGIGDWTRQDIVASLQPGSTHAQSASFGSGMEAVRMNLAELSKKDRGAIADYLMAVPAVPSRE